MSFEALDDPALVLPRVMDVHGTLLRLGFKGFTAKRRINFYRQFVPLFDGGVQAQFVARRISHVSLVLMLNDEGDGRSSETGRLWATYGYPERYPKRNKIIESFKKMLSEDTHVSVSFGRDKDLREFEKTISVLVENLKTKRVDCKLDVDSAEGVVVQTIPEYEALVSAVQQTLCSERVRDTGEWWIMPEYERTDPPPRVIPVNKYSRLPNFDRRRVIRSNVRRPV